MVFVVIDTVVGPTKLDMMMIDWLLNHSFPLSIIASKIDKIAAPKLEERKKQVAVELGRNTGDVFCVSSRKNLGITDLQNMVGKLLQI